MVVRVKICGLKTEAIVDVAIKAKADFLGFVHFKKSPRHLEFSVMTKFRNIDMGKTKKVVLLVDPDDDEIMASIDALGADYIQLHGEETPERLIDIKQRFDKKIIKAVGIDSYGDLKQAKAYDNLADVILFDAKPPKEFKNTLPGGNALSFDWRLLRNIKFKSDIMLAGGLNLGNVMEAIKKSGVKMVDVSSGVETELGIKNAKLVEEFIERIKYTET